MMLRFAVLACAGVVAQKGSGGGMGGGMGGEMPTPKTTAATLNTNLLCCLLLFLRAGR